VLSLWVLARTIPTVRGPTRCASVPASSPRRALRKRWRRIARSSAAAEPRSRGRCRSIGRSSATSPFSIICTRSARSHRFSDVVDDEDGGEALVMPHPAPWKCPSRRPGQRHEFVLPDREIDLPERGDPPTFRRVRFFQTLDVDFVHHTTSPRRRRRGASGRSQCCAPTFGKRHLCRTFLCGAVGLTVEILTF